MARPIVKWAGGKRQLLPVLKELIDIEDLKTKRYYEPFFGGGALFFDLTPKKAVLSDINGELMNLYIQVRDNCENLINMLNVHSSNHNEEYYYAIRELDRQEDYMYLPILEKAARTLYLNKTCFNGLYRVNSNGNFNTPSGKKEKLVFEDNNIRKISKLLKRKTINLKTGDYWNCVKKARRGSYIYFDPPYDYENENGFVSYSNLGFNREDLALLKQRCDTLINRGCKVIISNNNTGYVNDLFANDERYEIYTLYIVQAKRMINSKPLDRGEVEEVIIFGSNMNL